VITQDELRKFRQLSLDNSELERRHRQMRESFLKRIAEGEPVETGGLALKIQPVQQRRITYELVERVLGQDWVKWFQQYLPPTTVNYVKVEPSNR
jgi:hypothetical protein